ncbi:hypothetical protein M434DRAFT_27715 [Hypoxylon sp. CO27-5]|nr:hypothetical protein M434DRAFT_27715 [Hypoxylon sp. CO27-5]
MAYPFPDSSWNTGSLSAVPDRLLMPRMFGCFPTRSVALQRSECDGAAQISITVCYSAVSHPCRSNASRGVSSNSFSSPIFLRIRPLTLLLTDLDSGSVTPVGRTAFLSSGNWKPVVCFFSDFAGLDPVKAESHLGKLPWMLLEIVSRSSSADGKCAIRASQVASSMSKIIDQLSFHLPFSSIFAQARRRPTFTILSVSSAETDESVKMKFSIALFAIFSTVAMAELTKVPRSAKVAVRQDGSAQVQTAAMANANGEAVPFDTAGVYKDATNKGQ